MNARRRDDVAVDFELPASKHLHLRDDIVNRDELLRTDVKLQRGEVGRAVVTGRRED